MFDLLIAYVTGCLTVAVFVVIAAYMALRDRKDG